MNIGFFGNSSARLHGDPRSFIDQVQNHFNAKIIQIGVPQGSQERIYHQLKKTRGLVDIAVIFHGNKNYAFIPRCMRDLYISGIPEKADYLWSDEFDKINQPQTEEQFYYEFMHDVASKIPFVFETKENFINAMSAYKKYFWSVDLEKNRWEGALLCIDEFCNTQIPLTIHIIEPIHMPIWYPKLKSGITSREIIEIAWMPFDPNENYLPNHFSVTQNNLIATELIKLITENYKQSVA